MASRSGRIASAPYKYRILFRNAPLTKGEPWTEVAGARSLAAVRDELDSWQGPRLHHGDLVRVLDADQNETRLFVWDSDSGRLMRVGTCESTWTYNSSWVDLWELSESAREMMRAATAVPKPRLTLAACACARQVMRFIVAAREAVERSLNAAEAWASGSGPAEGMAARAFEARLEAAGLARGASEPAAQRAVFNAIDAAASAADNAAFCARMYRAPNRLVYSHWSYAEMAADEAMEAFRVAGMGNGVGSAGYTCLADAVRRSIPLSSLLCALLGLRDPLPLRGPNDAARAE